MMKNLLLTCLLFASLSSFGQGFIKRMSERTSFGIKAGLNYSDFGNANFDTEGLVGFHAGAIIRFKISESFSLSQDFIFSSQGAKTSDVAFGREDIKLSYLSIPFLIRYQTKFGLYVEAGTQFGIRVHEDIGHANVSNFTRKTDSGIVGGLGFQSKSGLGIGARYIAGVSKIGDIKLGNINTDLKNNVAQASLFYMF